MTATTAPTCPHCNEPLRSGTEGTRKVMACLAHGIIEPAETRRTQLKLPGLDRGRQKVLVKELEEPVLQRIIKALQIAGYQVETIVRRRKMQHCHQEMPDGSVVGCGRWFHQQGADGVSKRVGDLLVAVPKECPRAWIMLDVKGTTGTLTPDQRDTARKGLLFRVRSEAEAVDAVCRADERLKS